MVSEIRTKIEIQKEKGAEAKRMTYEADAATMDAEEHLSVVETKIEDAESAARKWQQRIAEMHEAHKDLAREAHVDVMELDQGSSELQETELKLTMAVADGDETLARMEEEIAQLKSEISELASANGIDCDPQQLKESVGNFFAICADGKHPLKSQAFKAVTTDLRLTTTDVATIKRVCEICSKLHKIAPMFLFLILHICAVRRSDRNDEVATIFS
eukprot:SAG31_NODE_4728_length_3001_cov_2.418677_3_plen_216_part_00